MDARAKELVVIGDKLFSERASLDSLFQEIAENFYPERADFTTNRQLGSEFADNLMDSFPVRARRDLGDAFASMLRPKSKPWFHAVAVDEDLAEDQQVKAWLEKVSKVTRRFLLDPKSKFVRATKEGDHDFAAFGQCVISAEERRDRTGLLFRCWHLRDVVWCEDDEGTIDTVHRKLRMTARGIVARYPKTAAKTVHACIQHEPYKEFNLRHIVVPVADYETQRRRPRNAEFVSLMVDADNAAVLEEKFLPEFPYIIPRWQTVSGWQYAFSPATIVGLPDGRLLQRITLTILESAEKQVDPPLVATKEAVKGGVEIFAGGVTWVDAEYDERLGEAVRALDLGKNAGAGANVLELIRTAIADGCYINKLMLPPASGEMTAYEVEQRMEEFIRQALPIFGPIEAEYNGGILDTTAQILLRLGAYGPSDKMPEALQGQGMTWRFESPLQEASERQKVNQFNDVAGLTQVAAQVDPSAPKNINTRKAFRDAVSGTGAPADWLLPQEEVDAAAEQDAAQAQMMQAAQMVQGGADVTKSVADAGMAVQQAQIGPAQQRQAA